MRLNRNSSLVRALLLFAIMVVSDSVLAQNSCIQTGVPSVNNTGHDRIRVNGADAAVKAAVDAWAACNAVSSQEMPKLTYTQSAGKKVEIYYSGGSFEGSSCTGTFGINGNDYEITLYISGCSGNDEQRVAGHELGHALGFDESNSCPSDFIMKQNTTALGPHADECEVAAEINETGTEGEPDPQGNSPMILDLGGRRGILTTGLNDPVLFDLDADGAPELITWSAPGSTQGFLALDLNGNGAIDDGGELFGTATLLADGIPAEHGFEGLAQYDLFVNGGNGDGVIDAGDAVWARLRIWSDANHDARTQRGELRRLERFGVVGLELVYIETRYTDPQGNWHRFRGHYRRRRSRAAGSAYTLELMEDIFFQTIR